MERHWTGLSHSVADNKILHVQLVDDVPAEFLGTGSPSHDAGLDVSPLRLGLPGGVQHVDEHGGGPVDGGALLCLYGRHAGRPVEAGAGDDRGGAVDETSERGTDVTEAVIERDGDTDSVRLERDM